MIKGLFLIASVFLSIFSVAQFPTLGLMGYYPFNINANDSSGNGFNGTVNGQVLAPGICSNGYLFSNNYIDCGDPPGNEFDLVGDATISMWVKLTSLPSSYYTLIGKDIGGGSNKKWFFAIHSQSLSFHINGPSWGGGFWTFSNNFPFTVNTFYHVVVVKSGPVNYQFFINGIAKGSGTLAQNVPDVPFNLRIGKNEGSNINAVLDEVYIYNRALSIQEVNQLYLKVSVTISATATQVCAGTGVTFTATPVNGGSTPFYQWKVNGINQGTNSASFDYTPADGDEVFCILTSNAVCSSGNPASSNTITINVTPKPNTNGIWHQ